MNAIATTYEAEIETTLVPSNDEIWTQVANAEQIDSAVEMSEAKVEAIRKTTQLAEFVQKDPLDIYMSETKRFALLSREEEHDLAVRMVEEGDSSAARLLVESNLRLVVKIAHEYQRAHQNLLDIVQEGNIGLMQAVSKFDPYRGVKLTSYATWWIRAYMLKFILSNHRLVKMGTTQAQRKLFFNLRKEKDRLESQGFSADSASIAQSLNVREKDVVEMQKRLASSDASFDAPFGSGDDGGTRTRHDVLEGTHGGRPDEVVEEFDFKARLKETIEAFADTLEGREERIFRGRWLSEEPMKLHELGTEFGVSRERARQLEQRLLGRAKVYLHRELGTAVSIDPDDAIMTH